MPRRVTLTDRQKDALLRLPTSQTDLLKHYTLSDEDFGHIRLRRRAHNRFGFALQLCVLRYPGRVLAPGELIPAEVIEFIGAQLGLGADDLVDYAAREETRHEHLAELRGLYGFRTFSGRGASELKEWLFREAEMAVSNEDIARRFVAECRRTRTVLPATSTIERLCAAALVDAERRIETRIASRLPMSIREQLLALLEETADDRVTRFVWLRQFEPGSNSSSANRLLDRLEYLQRVDLPEDLLAGVPAHRVTRLRRQGERYYADGMRDLPEDRRLAILAVCVSEWQAMLADAVVETHDRIVGRLYRASERICHAKVADEAGVVRDTLKSFAEIGGALVDAQDDGQPLGDVIASGSGWDGLKNPCCNGNQADRHHGRRSAQSCARRLSPLPPIRSTHVAPARSASCARCTAASGSGDGPSYRFERCRDDQLLAAQLEMASPPSGPEGWRRSPMGDRGAVPSARCVPLRRCLAY
ncbi:transposase of Tn5393-like transposon, N-terminal fragment [Corynebacterium urealyticum DSM 7109]|uniref:Transposase of Tn5393-like transposon, N-terminal n=1 Tax=Corynebacterium urealyticum (strain ATCC 43042 / DSM 7109) TaxID=504474 RepID=B1VIA8_CORU7|nr:transposase of Tn5393-like transposon, N-terminal fragment [Corynebacterium urealyticum DSM 7109]